MADTRSDDPADVIITSSGLAQIDRWTCAAGDPVIDAASMLAQFAAYAFEPLEGRLMRTAAAIFAREYFSRVPADWRVRLTPEYSTALVMIVGDIVQRQAEGWRRRAWTLTEEAALAADGALVFDDSWF